MSTTKPEFPNCLTTLIEEAINTGAQFVAPSKCLECGTGPCKTLAPAHDDYKRIDLQPGQHLEPCPVCAADAGLWQHSDSDTSPVRRVVMCTNGESFGPQDGIVNEGCLLYMPPPQFYKPTGRQAMAYWNEYAKALTEQARARRWTRAKVLRSELLP